MNALGKGAIHLATVSISLGGALKSYTQLQENKDVFKLVSTG